jgi:hypothetical protein
VVLVEHLGVDLDLESVDFADDLLIAVEVAAEFAAGGLELAGELIELALVQLLEYRD